MRRAGVWKRKSFLYSLSAIVFMLSITTFIFFAQSSSTKETTYLVSQKVLAMDTALDAVHRDLSRGAGIIGTRVLLSMTDQIRESGTYVDDTQATFTELFMNGSYKGNNITAMENTTFPYFTQMVQGAFRNDLKMSLTPLSVHVQQVTPWEILVSVNVSVYLTDRAKTAAWNSTLMAEDIIVVWELDDPLYTVQTNGFVTNQITKTNITTFVVGMDTSHLSYHAQQSLYKESSMAPSYLMRLEGDASPHPLGIESLVNLDKIASQGLQVKNNSVVDYIYFFNKNVNHTTITNMPNWFRLDEDHYDAYDVVNITLP